MDHNVMSNSQPHEIEEDVAASGSNDLALKSPRRRRFILLSILTGLTAVASPLAVPRILRRLELEPDLYRGPLIDRINTSLGRLDHREITPELFTQEIDRLFQETNLQTEFDEWLDDAHTYVLYRHRNISPWRQRNIFLFYIPPGTSHAPHAHHEVISIQCALKGTVIARQYERVRRLDPRTLALRPISDGILRAGESLRTTEFFNNVHWFGAEEQPALVLNYNINGGIKETFDPRGKREVGRYYLDPTLEGREGDLIVAPEIGADEAMAKFSSRPPSAFAPAKLT